jgi:hypothetical protein
MNAYVETQCCTQAVEKKEKNMLIKHDIPRYVEMISGNMKTTITFMKGTIANKYTLLGPKFQFVFVVWA